MLISVIIPTLGRESVVDTIDSLANNNYQNLELILVSQNKYLGRLARKLKLKYKNRIHQFNYFYLNSLGLSKARNFGIRKAKGNIVSFIDDDCIVRRGWLKNTYQSFEKEKDIAAVFGKVLPYKPYLHKGKICPCVFINNKKKVIVKPCPHWKNIGFGNNMTFKREVFNKVGYFKEWLGVNSIGKSAEDAEFVLRTLIKEYMVLYNPKVVVYHNRWLTPQKCQKQDLAYICGEMACYGHFFFKGFGFARKVVINNFRDSYLDLKKTLESLVSLKKNVLNNFIYFAKKLFSRLRGLIIAFYFTKISAE